MLTKTAISQVQCLLYEKTTYFVSTKFDHQKTTKNLVFWNIVFFVYTARIQKTKNLVKEKFADVGLELKRYQICVIHLVSHYE